MALSNRDFIEGLRSSRAYFLKHLKGLKPDQIVWKPYAECKSIQETIAHLVIDDIAALEAFQSGGEPEYEAIKAPEGSYEELLAALRGSHGTLIAWLETNLGEAPLDMEASAFGSALPAARAIAYISSEDFYHAGQVAFIRIATDPSWDYYGAIYGPEG